MRTTTRTMPILELISNVGNIEKDKRDFHKTSYGRVYYEQQLPALIKSINRLAEAMENEAKHHT